MPRKRKPKAVCDGGHTSDSDCGKGAEENRQIDQEEVRRVSQEIPGGSWQGRGLITHSIEDGTHYFSVRFKDKTDFSLRYACDMFVVGADFCDFKTGDFEMIREYMRPIPR